MKETKAVKKGCRFQHDNSISHTANITKDWLQTYGWEVLHHPPHSSDMARRISTCLDPTSDPCDELKEERAHLLRQTVISLMCDIDIAAANVSKIISVLLRVFFIIS